MAQLRISSEECKKADIDKFRNYNFLYGHKRLLGKIETHHLRGETDRRKKLKQIVIENTTCTFSRKRDLHDKNFRNQIEKLKVFFQYKTIEARLKSFNGQPIQEYFAVLLAISGFFNDRENKRLTCFNCGVIAPFLDKSSGMDYFLKVSNRHQNVDCSYVKEILKTLPIFIFKKIDKMFSDTTKDNLKFYSNSERQQSFQDCKQTDNGAIVTDELQKKYADAGFYRTTDGCLECPFCDIKVFGMPDDIDQLHCKNPPCPFKLLDGWCVNSTIIESQRKENSFDSLDQADQIGASVSEGTENILNKDQSKGATLGESSCPISKYRNYDERLKSFQNCNITDVLKPQYAFLGLYFSDDKIKCIACQFESDSIDTDIAFMIKSHFLANLSCDLIHNGILSPTINPALNPQHKDFASAAQRLKSFSNWIYDEKKIHEILASILAMAGYFLCTKTNPKLICFDCGVSADISQREFRIFGVHEEQGRFCPFAVQYLLSHCYLIHETEIITNSYSSEWIRFKSFENFTSEQLNFTTALREKYARVGLYWTQNEKHKEEVKCHFCHFNLVELRNEDTDPVGLHYRFQSSCPLLSHKSNNYPRDDQLFQKSIVIQPYSRQYDTTLLRLKQFRELKPPQNIISEWFVGILAIAGFVSINTQIKCFFCNIATDLREDINIFRLHVDKIKYCPFYIKWSNWIQNLLDTVSRWRQHNEMICSRNYNSEADRIKSFDGYADQFSIPEFTEELKQQYAQLMSITEHDMDPAVTHLRKNAMCSLMRLDEPRNIPINKLRLAKSLVRTKFFKRYRNPKTRFESFHRSQLSDQIDAATIYSLGLKGFFNINGKNKVICFYCYYEADISEGRNKILRDHQLHPNIVDCENKKQWIVTSSESNKKYSEAERLESFEYYVCNNKNFNAELRESYALAGFYSTSLDSEEITCAFCNLSIESLDEPIPDPVEMHRDREPTCTLLGLNELKNIPINDEVFQKAIGDKPMVSDYESTAVRLETYNKFNLDKSMWFDLLAAFGFYKTNEDETKIMCFYCGVEAVINDDITVIINKHFENNKFCRNWKNVHHFIEMLCDVVVD